MQSNAADSSSVLGKRYVQDLTLADSSSEESHREYDDYDSPQCVVKKEYGLDSATSSRPSQNCTSGDEEEGRVIGRRNGYCIVSDDSSDGGGGGDGRVTCPDCERECALDSLLDDTTCLFCDAVLQSDTSSSGRRYHIGQNVYFLSKVGVPYHGIVIELIDSRTICVRSHDNSNMIEDRHPNELSLKLDKLLSSPKQRNRAKVDRYVPPSNRSCDEYSDSDCNSENGQRDRPRPEDYVKMVFYKAVEGQEIELGVVARYSSPHYEVAYKSRSTENLKEADLIRYLKRSYIGRKFYMLLPKEEGGGEAAGVVKSLAPPNVRVRYTSGAVKKMSIPDLEKWTKRSYVGKRIFKGIGGVNVVGTVVSYDRPYFTIKYETGEEEQLSAAELCRQVEKSFVGRTVKKDFGREFGVWEGKVISFNSLFYRVEYTDKSKEDYYDEEIHELVLPPKKTIKRQKLSYGSAAPAWQAPPSNISNHLFSGLRPLSIEVEGGGGKSNLEAGRTFFSELFPADRILILKQKVTGNAAARRPDASFEQFGCRYSLAGVKKRDEGMTFNGINKECFDFTYVMTSGPPDVREISLARELEKVADFASIKSSRKLAARLELLHSASLASCLPRRLSADDFEIIDEEISDITQEYMGDGCGFIGEKQLYELVGGSVDKLLSIQVRVFSPKLGVWKGMLCKKPNIDKIQLTPSMRKVKPSIVASPDVNWASLIVVRSNPSSSSTEVGKVFAGCEMSSSFERKRMSKMIKNLMIGLGCPKYVVATHAMKTNPDNCWLVGLADPTYCLPPGHIFVTGFKSIISWSTFGDQNQIFVTRSPCVLKEHGRMLPAVVSRPHNMPKETWDWLLGLPFGAILFSTAGKGVPLAATCASGDLDGDLYMTCWDKTILRHINPCEPPVPVVRVGAAIVAPNHETETYRNPNWLKDVQCHLTDNALNSEYALIGKLYRQMEKVAQISELGMSDPDYISYANAYISAIDHGKHDLDVPLPEHLRSAVGLK